MPLCDTLLRLAEDPAFYIPKWSDDILRELRSTLQRMGYPAAQADRRVAAMETAFEDARVNGYECLVDSMTSDPKDRHVLAAAVRRISVEDLHARLSRSAPRAVALLGALR